MPGSGKSTVGVILAKRLGLDFVDTDLLIQSAEGRTLQEIVDRDGYLALRRIEERLLSGLSLHHHVIATGGSAVYSRPAMKQLKTGGIVVWLDVDLPALRARVRDFSSRGLAKAPDQTLEALFAEREPLYRAYADLVVPCHDAGQDEVADRIIRALQSAESAGG